MVPTWLVTVYYSGYEVELFEFENMSFAKEFYDKKVESKDTSTKIYLSKVLKKN